MASFIGRLQNILVSKLFAVVLISLLLSCLSIFPIANASAQTCGWNWDILSISGIKTNYQPGETISGNISFRLHNKANSGAIQQLLIGIIDSQNKVIDVKCVYNGAPKDCPEWTTGTASFSLKAPVTPGNYKVIAADDLENSCSDAINRFPSLCSSTSPYCKDITTITISAGRTEIAPPIPTSPTSPPPTLPSQPDTGKKNGTVGTPDTTKPSSGIAPIALNKNTIIIISFVAALVILTLFASRKKGSKHFTKSILLLVLISFIGYLFWVYAIPLIVDWFRHNLGTIIKVLLALVVFAVIGVVVWISRNTILEWFKEKIGKDGPPPPPPPNSEKEGYIYIARCPSHEPDLYKIGRTKNHPISRMGDLGGSTSSPDSFLLIEHWRVTGVALAESLVRKALEKYRPNPKREFFKARLKTILPVVEESIKDLIVENGQRD
jgi:hypothetical protein